MDTLKPTVVTALLNLPDFTDIDDMIAVWRRIQFHRELAELPTPPPLWSIRSSKHSFDKATLWIPV